MIIIKELKNVTFEYDFNSKNLTISRSINTAIKGKIREIIELTRSEMFSLSRFIIRIAQKGNPKKSKQLELLKGGGKYAVSNK